MTRASDHTWSEPCQDSEPAPVRVLAVKDKPHDIYGIPAQKLRTMTTITPAEEYL